MYQPDKNFFNLIKNSDITAYLNSIKVFDEETYKHCIEVGQLTYLFLMKKEDKYTSYEITEITKGALIHDIGKIYLPFGLIRATKNLDSYERKLIEEHPLIGYVYIKDTELSDIIKAIVLKHHCQLDDSGYPQNETITEKESYVWIINMMDKFNAMTSVRPFKTPLSFQDAFSEIIQMSKQEKLPYQNLLTFKEVIKENQL